MIAAALALLIFALGGPAAAQASGSLDPTIGVGGVVVTQFAPELAVLPNSREILGGNALTIQRDGKLLVAGSARFRGDDGRICSDFVLARYERDESPDLGFDSGGVARADFGGDDYANRGALQEDGSIVVAGTAYAGQYERRSPVLPPRSRFALARYRPDGTPDASFGSGGLATAPTRSVAAALGIQDDGKIIAVGSGEAAGLLFIARYLP